MTTSEIAIICTVLPLIGTAIGWLIKGETNAQTLKKLKAESATAEATSFKVWIDLYKSIADNVKIELQEALKEVKELREDIHKLKHEFAMVLEENTELKKILDNK